MRKTRTILAILCVLGLVPIAALGAPAKVKVSIVDETGRPVSGALIMFARTDDPTQQLSVGENEAGSYEDSFTLAGEAATWNLSRVVVDGMLPVRVSVVSSGPGGAAIQEIDDMELNPGIPVPPLEVAAGGKVRIDLVLGDQADVMARFLEARKAARAQAEQEAAEQAAAAADQEAYTTALRLYNEGDLEGSLPHFQEALQRHPEDAELRLTYVRVLYKANRFEEFKAAAQVVLDADPANTELRMMLYSGLRERKEFSAALEQILELKKLGARGADLLPHLDFLAKSMGQNRQAIPAWQAILDIDRSNREACVELAYVHAKIGEPRLADQYLQRAVDLAPEQAPGLYYEMASQLLTKKNPSPAAVDRGIALVNEALALDPGFAPAYKRLGLALWIKNDIPGTRAAFEKYLELNPDGEDKQQIEEYLVDLQNTE